MNNKQLHIIMLLVSMCCARSLFGGLGANVQGMFNLLRNPAFTNTLRSIGRGAGELAEGVSNAARNAHERAQRAYAKRIQELHAIKDDNTRSASERQQAREELEKIAAAQHRSQMQFEENQQKMAGEFIQIGSAAVQGVVNESIAQFAHEREMQKVNLQAKQAGKAAVEQTKEWIKAMTDPKNAALAVGVSAGIFGCWFGLKHGIGFIADKYSKPALADDDKTSLKFGPVNMLKALISGRQQEASALSDVILKPALAKRIEVSVQSLKNTVKNGGYLKNIMFWGQPGTGKTMLAMRMARSCGLEYIYFSASNLETFSTEEATRQLVQLFRYAQSSSRKLMIIIDEAELLLGDRNKPEVTDKKRTLLNLVLAYTGTESRDYMICVLTNRPQDIDEAFLTRCDDRIQIAAPEASERRAILQLYVDKILKSGATQQAKQPGLFSYERWFGGDRVVRPLTIAEEALSEHALDELASKLTGWVGRDIFKFVNEIYSSAGGTLDNKVTKELIDQVLVTKLAERRDYEQGFIRDGVTV